MRSAPRVAFVRKTFFCVRNCAIGARLSRGLKPSPAAFHQSFAAAERAAPTLSVGMNRRFEAAAHCIEVVSHLLLQLRDAHTQLRELPAQGFARVALRDMRTTVAPRARRVRRIRAKPVATRATRAAAFAARSHHPPPCAGQPRAAHQPSTNPAPVNTQSATSNAITHRLSALRLRCSPPRAWLRACPRRRCQRPADTVRRRARAPTF